MESRPKNEVVKVTFRVWILGIEVEVVVVGSCVVGKYEIESYGALEREISRKTGFCDFFGDHYCGYISKFCGFYLPYLDP